MKRDEHISSLVERLRSFQAANSAERLRDSLLCRIEDPLTPKTKTGGFRINPILLLMAALAVMAIGTFLFFSLVQP
jgi:hypothetical protein